jgi:hypothetical protein
MRRLEPHQREMPWLRGSAYALFCLEIGRKGQDMNGVVRVPTISGCGHDITNERSLSARSNMAALFSRILGILIRVHTD